jgi:macrolide-specific efflux system membrane fusion protein
MNKILKNLIIILLLLIALFAVFYFLKMNKNGKSKETYTKVYPHRDDIKDFVTTTGEIQPQNRVEIKPPIAGRIEKIFVKEGDRVKKGDILMLMSSTERAALLDTASAKSEATRKYWEELYKPIPIIAPITGEVIVRNIEAGQTVETSGVILVLSNRLIIKANVDETDIGRIKLGQKALISLDAYPDVQVSAKVNHIAFESTVVNNVTTYSVDILPKYVPKVFRSGMSTNINIIVQSRKNALLIPLEAVIEKSDKKFVLIALADGSEKDYEKINITTGLESGDFVEVLSGVDEKDCILIKQIDISSKSKKSKKNPFMPDRSKMTGSQNSQNSQNSQTTRNNKG